MNGRFTRTPQVAVDAEPTLKSALRPAERLGGDGLHSKDTTQEANFVSELPLEATTPGADPTLELLAEEASLLALVDELRDRQGERAPDGRAEPVEDDESLEEEEPSSGVTTRPPRYF